jgi:hypothetical protein
MVRLPKLNKPSQSATRTIRELKAEAQRTRLEAMRLAALILTRMDEALARVTLEAVNTDDLAVLQLQHAALIKRAEDLQTKLDRLEADQYDQNHRL